ncbi:Hypothetical predicted protein [Mytilus galloprovincialis]|uniref:Integrase catalytic domain-containing protein n=1 Tax=Mytilus galloprovincialis TaxID=29158 RepID=A0A8B6C522_MYTGA|nr:Hypothetical predicted protein [Mytilus galloprovincialis]
MVARWISVLDTYDMVLEHRRGALHCNADTLSRRPHRKCKRIDCPDCTNADLLSVENTETCSTKAASEIPTPIRVIQTDPGETSIAVHDDVEDDSIPNWLSMWSEEQISCWQKADPDIKIIFELKSLHLAKPPKECIQGCSYSVRTLWNLWDLLIVQNNVLYYLFETDTSEVKNLLIAPYVIRSKILNHLHNAHVAGHLGRDKTLNSVRRRFFWPGMTSDVSQWCRTCNQCAQAKPGPGLGHYYLQQSTVGFPFDRIAIDILGPCPVTRNANEYLIVITDYFTKWTESFAVSNHTALTVADKLVTEVFCRFGVPSQLHSDQGREFMSDLFTQICVLLNIDKTRTCPYRPQSDGLVERMNRTLIQMLSIFVNDNRNDWDDHLPYLLMAYRSTIQDSTGFAPHKLMFGRDMMCPIDIISGFMPKNENILCPVQYVEWVKHTLSLTYEFVNSNLNRAASRQKKNYDRGAKPRAFDEGSFVWRWYPPKAGLKLALGWTGPYHVEKKLSDVLYKIRLLPERRFFGRTCRSS